MTLHEAWVWFIWPAIVAATIGFGGIWLAKHTP
jgi:hypothetical protein